MKTRTMFQSILLMCVVSFAASVSASTGKDIQLTDKDKAQIIKSILSDVDFLNRGLRVGERKEEVYLSTENISPAFLPEIRGVKIVLVSPEEVEERSKTGFGYYSFGEFKVSGSKVLVSFGDTWRNDRGGGHSYRSTHYEFRKVAGRWRGKEVSFSVGMS